MATEVMDLPRSGYKILRLIIIGYLHQGGSERKPASYDEVSKASSVSPTMVSGNNKALAALGILEKSGQRRGYRLTEDGYELARALEFEESELTRRSLTPLLAGNPKIGQALNALRTRGGMSVEDFAKHLLIVVGASNTRVNMTGARTIIEMLATAGLLEQADDQLTAIRPDHEEASSETTVVQDENDEEEEAARGDEVPERGQRVPFAIRIEISLNSDDLIDDERFAAISERLTHLRGLAG